MFKSFGEVMADVLNPTKHKVSITIVDKQKIKQDVLEVISKAIFDNHLTGEAHLDQADCAGIASDVYIRLREGEWLK